MKTQVIDGTPVNSDNAIHAGRGIHGYGIITREFKSLKAAKSKCQGCYENFYNSQNADNGGCWSFASAKVVNKVGYSSIHCANGPDTKMTKTLSCWHGVRK